MRRLYAELEFLAGLTLLEARTARMCPHQVRSALAALEARRARRLQPPGTGPGAGIRRAQTDLLQGDCAPRVLNP